MKNMIENVVPNKMRDNFQGQQDMMDSQNKDKEALIRQISHLKRVDQEFDEKIAKLYHKVDEVKNKIKQHSQEQLDDALVEFQDHLDD